jgi:SAM-dependent methyltransferase
MANQVKFECVLACPRCGGKLEVLELSWSCRQCAKEWPIDSDGIVRLSASNEFFGADQQGMQELIGEIRGMSAEEFSNEIPRLEKKYRDFKYDYCLDPTRADWTVLGDFKDKVVVDLGCGYGTLSLPLASRAKTVIGLDGALERLQFFSLVVALRQIANVTLIHGNVFDLPFREGAIDAFLCMGLLEYSGTWKGNAKPSEVLKEFLRYLHKYLTAKGEIWIGIENRLNPAYLIGRTHHGDVPFTPLMPRILANGVSYLFKSEPYKTWTYSQRGYRRMLRMAGFERVEFYCAFPSYQRPRFLLPSGQKKVFTSLLKNPGIGSYRPITARIGLHVYRILDRMNLLGDFAPAFLIRAMKTL